MEPGEKYIYCFINCAEGKQFIVGWLSDRNERAYTVNYMGLAAVVSDISPRNAEEHELVVAEVFKDFDVLPLQFGTIARKDNLIKKEFLRGERADYLRKLLRRVGNKFELGLEAFWRSDPHQSQNRRQRQAIAAKIPEKALLGQMGARAILDEMLMEAVGDIRKTEVKRILPPLESLAVDMRLKEITEPRMILDAAFLVSKEHRQEFTDALHQLDKRYGSEIEFIATGPFPPYSFVNPLS